MQLKKAVTIGAVLSFSVGLLAGTIASAQNDYKVDNTIQNRRDRDPNNPTAQDQSNRKADVKLTATLRRAVVAQRGLSMNAKNIKIIDKNGCVILRGPVNNLHEKQLIDSIAQQYCGVNYKNELEVRTLN